MAVKAIDLRGRPYGKNKVELQFFMDCPDLLSGHVPVFTFAKNKDVANQIIVEWWDQDRDGPVSKLTWNDSWKELKLPIAGFKLDPSGAAIVVDRRTAGTKLGGMRVPKKDAELIEMVIDKLNKYFLEKHLVNASARSGIPGVPMPDPASIKPGESKFVQADRALMPLEEIPKGGFNDIRANEPFVAAVAVAQTKVKNGIELSFTIAEPGLFDGMYPEVTRMGTTIRWWDFENNCDVVDAMWDSDKRTLRLPIPMAEGGEDTVPIAPDRFWKGGLVGRVVVSKKDAGMIVGVIRWLNRVLSNKKLAGAVRSSVSRDDYYNDDFMGETARRSDAELISRIEKGVVASRLNELQEQIREREQMIVSLASEVADLKSKECWLLEVENHINECRKVLDSPESAMLGRQELRKLDVDV